MDGKVQVNMTDAGANGMMVSGPMLQFVNDYINGMLANPGYGVAASVETDDGSITVSLGM